MSLPFDTKSNSTGWDTDTTANKFKQTYFNNTVDISGSLQIQYGGIHVKKNATDLSYASLFHYNSRPPFDLSASSVKLIGSLFGVGDSYFHSSWQQAYNGSSYYSLFERTNGEKVHRALIIAAQHTQVWDLSAGTWTMADSDEGRASIYQPGYQGTYSSGIYTVMPIDGYGRSEHSSPNDVGPGSVSDDNGSISGDGRVIVLVGYDSPQIFNIYVWSDTNSKFERAQYLPGWSGQSYFNNVGTLKRRLSRSCLSYTGKFLAITEHSSSYHNPQAYDSIVLQVYMSNGDSNNNNYAKWSSYTRLMPQGSYNSQYVNDAAKSLYTRAFAHISSDIHNNGINGSSNKVYLNYWQRNTGSSPNNDNKVRQGGVSIYCNDNASNTASLGNYLSRVDDRANWPSLSGQKLHSFTNGRIVQYQDKIRIQYRITGAADHFEIGIVGLQDFANHPIDNSNNISISSTFVDDFDNTQSGFNYVSADASLNRIITYLTAPTYGEPTLFIHDWKPESPAPFSVTENGGVYYIDNVQQPQITLARGDTYTFNLNIPGHPFVIQSTSNTYDGNSVWNSGITYPGDGQVGGQSGDLIFTVGYNTPDTLYYVCQYHSGMGGTININNDRHFRSDGTRTGGQYQCIDHFSHPTLITDSNVQYLSHLSPDGRYLLIGNSTYDTTSFTDAGIHGLFELPPYNYGAQLTPADRVTKITQMRSSDAIEIRVNGTNQGTFGSSGFTAITKQFEIDHPIKSDHRLRHTCVESPQVANVYPGRSTLQNGTSQVNLDSFFNMTEGTFQEINKNVFVATSNETDYDRVKGTVNGNILTILCKNAASGATVAWNVFGLRNDRTIKKTGLYDSSGNYISEYK